MAQKIDPRITKKRVTMTSAVILPPGEDGQIRSGQVQAIDYVREDILDAYVDNAKSSWDLVQVSEEYDAGPLGFDGPTYIPDVLPVQNAGLYYPATSGSDVEAALVEAGDELAVATEGSDTPVQLSTLQEN